MRTRVALAAGAAYLSTGAGLMVWAGRASKRRVTATQVAVSALVWPVAFGWATYEVLHSRAKALIFADERHHGAVATGPVGTTALEEILGPQLAKSLWPYEPVAKAAMWSEINKKPGSPESAEWRRRAAERLRVESLIDEMAARFGEDES